MKGSQGIPALQLETLNRLVSKMDRAPNLFFSTLFGSTEYDSDTIRWEIEYGSAGMTPFVAPGAVAPATGLDGVGEASAKAAFYKEKMYFDEVILNNLREPGSYATYQTAERKIARGVQKLARRLDRREEWMFAQMMINGTLTYSAAHGVQFSINYGIPSNHSATVANDWGTANATPIKDIFNANQVLSEDAGVKGNYAICNTNVLKLLLFDADLQDLLKKSAYGEGDLFSNPAGVLGDLLGLGTIMIYDELYEVPGWLLSNITGDSSTTAVVDDATDFEVGTVRILNMADNTYSDVACSAVNKTTNTLTIATTPAGADYVAGRDKIIMRKKFIADDKFLIFSSTDDAGAPIAEFMKAPYGIPRRWGKYADTKDEWDPEGVWLRIQNKGLPVMYHNDTTYTLTVTT